MVMKSNNNLDCELSRRSALKVGLATLGVATVGVSATALSGCSTNNPEEQINSANEELIGSINLNETILPLGSVVETAAGRFMVIGQFLFDQSELAGNYDVYYDYYGTVWPTGVSRPGTESVLDYKFNKEDIKKILFLGRISEEEKDYRDYLQGRDIDSTGATKAETPAYAAEVDSQFGPAQDQLYRLQGKRSEELYGEKGNEFHGGLLKSNLSDSVSSSEAE